MGNILLISRVKKIEFNLIAKNERVGNHQTHKKINSAIVCTFIYEIIESFLQVKLDFFLSFMLCGLVGRIFAATRQE